MWLRTRWVDLVEDTVQPVKTRRMTAADSAGDVEVDMVTAETDGEVVSGAVQIVVVPVIDWTHRPSVDDVEGTKIEVSGTPKQQQVHFVAEKGVQSDVTGDIFSAYDVKRIVAQFQDALAQCPTKNDLADLVASLESKHVSELESEKKILADRHDSERKHLSQQISDLRMEKDKVLLRLHATAALVQYTLVRDKESKLEGQVGHWDPTHCKFGFIPDPPPGRHVRDHSFKIRWKWPDHLEPLQPVEPQEFLDLS